MEIWLKNTSKRVKLPVLPSGYRVSSGQGNTIVNVAALGEVNLKGKRNLQEVTFSSFFPKRRESYCEKGTLRSPKEYVVDIEEMKRRGTVKLIITGVPISMDVTIESFEWEERDGSGDIYYTLSLKEYRKLNIPKSTLVKEVPQAIASEAETARSEPEQTSTVTYEVKPGDCLSVIAKRLTGSASWTAIYEQNKGVIGSNPNLIKPGQILTIPGAKR